MIEKPIQELPLIWFAGTNHLTIYIKAAEAPDTFSQCPFKTKAMSPCKANQFVLSQRLVSIFLFKLKTFHSPYKINYQDSQ